MKVNGNYMYVRDFSTAMTLIVMASSYSHLPNDCMRMPRIRQHFMQLCWKVRIAFLVPDKLAALVNEPGEIAVSVVDIFHS